LEYSISSPLNPIGESASNSSPMLCSLPPVSELFPDEPLSPPALLVSPGSPRMISSGVGHLPRYGTSTVTNAALNLNTISPLIPPGAQHVLMNPRSYHTPFPTAPSTKTGGGTSTPKALMASKQKGQGLANVGINR
jgi:hypothetical protein